MAWGKASGKGGRFCQPLGRLIDSMRMTRGADAGVLHAAKDDNALDRTPGEIGTGKPLFQRQDEPRAEWENSPEKQKYRGRQHEAPGERST